MPNREHVKILNGGVDAWNDWRKNNLKTDPDSKKGSFYEQIVPDTPPPAVVRLRVWEIPVIRVRDTDFERMDVCDLRGADLTRADLTRGRLSRMDLHGATLRDADLQGADLTKAKLSKADLSGANFSGANLTHANLSEANLSGANLEGALLVSSNMEGSVLTGSRMYGISAWDVRLDRAEQSNLIITRSDQPDIQVDNLEVAQFICPLLNYRKIRYVIDEITSKLVLILGRFTPERKTVLDGTRNELRKKDYLPVLFDFEKPSRRDITETVRTLAHMARFIIADITDAKRIPQELMTIVPFLPSVPVQPLLVASQREYGMFEHFRRFPWVLEPVLYNDQENLLAELGRTVIVPAEAKAKEQTRKQRWTTLSATWTELSSA